MIDVVVRVLLFFLQSVLTRIDRHICKTVIQKTSFHKTNLGSKRYTHAKNVIVLLHKCKCTLFYVGTHMVTSEGISLSCTIR